MVLGSTRPHPSDDLRPAVPAFERETEQQAKEWRGREGRSKRARPLGLSEMRKTCHASGHQTGFLRTSHFPLVWPLPLGMGPVPHQKPIQGSRQSQEEADLGKRLSEPTNWKKASALTSTSNLTSPRQPRHCGIRSPMLRTRLFCVVS